MQVGSGVGLGLTFLAMALNLTICSQESRAERILCFPGI